MSIPGPIQNILNEMKQTLKDLKVQVGRELPHFAKLEGNITALEQPRSHFGVDPLPEPFTPEPVLISGGSKQLNSQSMQPSVAPSGQSQTIVINTPQRSTGE